MTTEPRTIFAVWSEPDGAGWQGLIRSMSDQAWAAEEESAYGEVRTLVEKVRRLDGKLALTLEEAMLAYGNANRDFGVVLGYAVARTAPTGLEGLEDWLERASEYAGLEEGEPGK